MKKFFSAFAEGEADVLLGTQMIVKGHDFPRVSLVGILAADLSLNDSDYRAGENLSIINSGSRQSRAK